MKLTVLVLTFLFLISISPTEAQLKEAEVIQRLKESRENIQDFSANLIQEKRVFLLREKVVSRGRIRFKSPDKFFVEFFPPESTQMVFDGKIFLIYFKEEQMAERYHVYGNPLVEKYLLFSKDPFQEKLAEWKILEDRKSFLVMEILPRERDALFARTKLLISKKDWMVTALEMVERNGDTTFLHYSNVKLNSGLKDSDFSILLPSDVKVTDIK